MLKNHFIYVAKRGDSEMVKERIPELDECTQIDAVDNILTLYEPRLKSTKDKWIFLIEYMGAHVHMTGELSDDEEYLLARQEFVRGYWKDLNGQ